MDSRSLKFAAEACAGSLVSGSAETVFNRVSTDSRSVQPGDLFFALSGEKFDGHNFLAEVIAKKVAAVVVDERRANGIGGGVIAANSPREALGKLAARYRADFNLPVVAVGGSNGKTTAKELIASVLRQKLVTVWSEASFNNDIGVPMTLLKLDTTTQAAVLEVGTNHPGELAPLVRMIQPEIGVITSIGREHLEFFGDISGVVREEGALAEQLPANGTLFLNGDSEWSATIAQRTKAKVVTVGTGKSADWQAKILKMDASGVKFYVESAVAGFAGEYQTGLLGQHQAVNALFAIAIGAELGLSPKQVRQGVAECKPAKMRLQLLSWNGICILDDSYNANADSMLAALHTLKELPGNGKKIAVLGEMAELGVQSVTAHAEIGRKVAELGLDEFFAIGKMAGVQADAARSAGLKSVQEFADAGPAAIALKKLVRAGDTILIKASRSARLERLVAALKPSEAVEKN